MKNRLPKDRPRPLVVFLFLFYTLTICLLNACSGRDDAVRNVASTDSIVLPDTEIKGTTIYIYDRGRVTSSIQTERILKFDSKDSTMGYVVHASFFDTSGAINSTLVGDSALIREKTDRQTVYGHVLITSFDVNGKVSATATGDSAVVTGGTNHMHLYGQVVVESEDNRKLETDYLHWNPDINKFQTDSFVRFTHGENNVMTGWGFEAGQKLDHIRIYQASGQARQLDSLGK